MIFNGVHCLRSSDDLSWAWFQCCLPSAFDLALAVPVEELQTGCEHWLRLACSLWDMLQLVAGSGNAKYVWCCALNSTCPGVFFLPTCLSSGLFSSLTQRHGGDGVGRSAHNSYRQEESPSGKNYWKKRRSFRRHQLHKPILALAALPHTVMRTYWDRCNPAPHLWQQPASDFKERPKNCSEEDDLLPLSPYPNEWSKHLNLTASFGLAWASRRSFFISSPYPKRRNLQSTPKYFLPALFVLCQHVRSLYDPGSTGSAQVLVKPGWAADLHVPSDGGRL